MKQLDWYNECDIYLLARLEAGVFIGSPCNKHEQEHFNILKDYYFNLWVNDFEESKKAAEDFRYEAVRTGERD